MHAPSISLVALALALVANAKAEAGQCYNPKLDFYELMGTRTAYELVHGHDNLRPPMDPKCKPLQLWVLSRHGTKYPENKDMPRLLNVTEFRDRILKNHEANGTGQLCAADLENLRNWRLDPNINNRTNEELAPQGEKDLEEFAKRLKKAYPELLDGNSKSFKTSDYAFKTTNRQRTHKSMYSFAKVIVGEDRERVGQFSRIAYDNDTLLMPHKNCKAWDREFKEKNLKAEHQMFVKGPEINGVIKGVSERLGFKDTLDYDTVKAAWDMCRYEVAWYPGQISTWCSIFKKKDLEIFEYAEDLDFYYCCGPGREMSSKLGCKTLADMLAHFKEIEAGRGEEQPKGIFYFAHSMTLQVLLAALGIGKEATPFTSHNYATAANRKYHVSKLGPFATNVLAVFYRCDGNQPTYKVSLHVAEVPASIENCENGVCDWAAFKKKYEPSVSSCSFDFCETGAGMRNISMGFFATLLVSLGTLFHG